MFFSSRPLILLGPNFRFSHFLRCGDCDGISVVVEIMPANQLMRHCVIRFSGELILAVFYYKS